MRPTSSATCVRVDRAAAASGVCRRQRQVGQRVKGLLFDALGGFLLDRNGDGSVTLNDIDLLTVGSTDDVSEVQFNFNLGRTFVSEIPIEFDVGLPGLGLQTGDNSAVRRLHLRAGRSASA
jgi:hypothetical protein